MSTTTKWECILQGDGQIVSTVIDRGESECVKVRQQFTSHLGREISDEQIGPECDDVHEVQY